VHWQPDHPYPDFAGGTDDFRVANDQFVQFRVASKRCPQIGGRSPVGLVRPLDSRTCLVATIGNGSYAVTALNSRLILKKTIRSLPLDPW